MSFSFNAAPRVVRNRRKFRREKELDTTKLTPWELERWHVKEQEEKLKIENMKRQLENFKKEKKRPYEIKPSAHPRIPIDLKFFLTDDFYIKKPETFEMDAQTDELVGAGAVETRIISKNGPHGPVVEYAPEVTYIPKKTGVDVYAQVENDELFDFDREVKPILDVLVTKTLEQATLELEEDQEIENMIEFKKNYVKKKCQKNEDDWKDIIEVEMDKIDDKERIVNDLSFIDIKRINLSHKVRAHSIASIYLRDLLPRTIESLTNRGFYQPQESDYFTMDYTEYIIDEVMKVLNEDQLLDSKATKLYNEIEPTLTALRDPFDEEEKIKQEQSALALLTAKKTEREVFFFLRNKEENCPLVFSCFLSMLWSNTYNEYQIDMYARYEEIQAKLDAGNISPEEFEDQLVSELPNPAMETFSAKFGIVKDVSFAFANNPYVKLLKDERPFNAGVAFFSPEGILIETVNLASRKGQMGIWDTAEKVVFLEQEKYEEILHINIEKMSEKSCEYALIYLWASDFDSRFADLENMKISQYKLFNKNTGVNYFKGRFDKAMDNIFLINPEEGVNEESETPRNCILGCFLIYRDEGKGWGFDHVKSYGFGYQSLEDYLKIVGDKLPPMHHRGNMKELINFWTKKAEEEQAAAAVISSEIDTVLKSKKTINSKSARRNKDEEEDSEDMKSEKNEEHSKPEESSNKEGDTSSKLIKKYMPDNGHAFIGPVLISFSDTYLELISKLDKYIEEKHPLLKASMPDGFELLNRVRPLENEPSISTILKDIRDYREIRIKKLVRVIETEEGDPEEEEGDNENTD